MLTENEIINNALKEMIYMEELTAKKYESIAEQITEPKLQDMLKGMEMASRSNYKTLLHKMSSLGIQ
ncbi:MAG: hypothetical protein N3B21_00580 [Clostridia bacterium]|nr:hypothetical protein [Clostridia bacterium]